MKFNEQPQNNYLPPNQGVSNPSRRNFLKGAGHTVGAAVASVAGLHLGIEEIRHDRAMNALREKFLGKEESFSHAEEAVTLLLLEMKKEKITSLSTVGGCYRSNELVELRDFLTDHLSSKSASRYGSDIVKAFSQGNYNERFLQEIKKEARMLSK